MQTWWMKAHVMYRRVCVTRIYVRCACVPNHLGSNRVLTSLAYFVVLAQPEQQRGFEQAAMSPKKKHKAP